MVYSLAGVDVAKSAETHKRSFDPAGLAAISTQKDDFW